MDDRLVKVWRDCGVVFTIFICFIVVLYLVNDSPVVVYSGVKNSLDGCSHINSVLVNVSFIEGVHGYTDKCGFTVHCYSNCFNKSLEDNCVNNTHHCWSINSIKSIDTMDSCLKDNDIYYCACKLRNNCVRGFDNVE